MLITSLAFIFSNFFFHSNFCCCKFCLKNLMFSKLLEFDTGLKIMCLLPF